MRWTVVARVVACWLPLHVGLPFGLAWLHAQAGRDVVYLTVAGIHVVFPLLYMLSQAVGHFRTGELLLALALNHLVMFSVGGWLMWFG